MASFRPPFFRNRAFTLIELLVAVTVLSILVALCMPVMGRLREKGKIVSCANNLRHHIAAFITFSADNNGYLPYMTQDKPPAGLITFQYWWQVSTGTGHLMPTPPIKQQATPQSPAITRETAWRGWYCPVHVNELISEEYRVGYSINSKIVANVRRKLNTITSPGATPFLFCFYNKGEKLLMGNYYANAADDGASNTGYRFFNGITNAHTDGSSNFAFLDGHIEVVRAMASREDYQKAYQWSASN